MKTTIINCDMCGARIYRNGWFEVEAGAVAIRVEVLEKMTCCDPGYYGRRWVWRKCYICPRCVGKIKEMCRDE